MIIVEVFCRIESSKESNGNRPKRKFTVSKCHALFVICKCALHKIDTCSDNKTLKDSSKRVKENFLEHTVHSSCDFPSTLPVKHLSNSINQLYAFCHHDQSLPPVTETFTVSGEFYSCFMPELRHSKILRNMLINYLDRTSETVFISNNLCYFCAPQKIEFESISRLRIIVNWPAFPVIDKEWNRIISYQLWSKIELENAMSWLSTLGGAFSALGNQEISFAKNAAEISMKQYKIAISLGNPILVSKCKIYMAMSMIQKGFYRHAKSLLRSEYKFALSPIGKTDFRLMNMCLAVWNQLKFLKTNHKELMYIK
ncbi:hypothetical protein GQR58_015576 [Nymphon striatum]|nr:hypothetical protein GQR58_015576 [Nymphon striatum]